MDAIDRLRRDHRLLRAKLDILEGALRMDTDTWFVLREVSFTLSRQLQDHMRREEELMAACRKALIPPPTASPSATLGQAAERRRDAAAAAGGGMTPALLAELAVEHKDEPEHLRTVNRLFLSESGHSLERIRPALTEVIQGLRRHMAEEEAQLFPVLERTLAGREAAVTEVAPGRLDETMTVNCVIHQFPGTRRVFERLFVNVSLEGCTCLDELAWQHGMTTEELLAKLEGAAGGWAEPAEADPVSAET